MSGYTLDTGALIAIERGNPRIRALLAEALRRQQAIRVPSGALAQAWRDGSRQALLARFVRADEVQHVALDAATARAVGVLCAVTGTHDVVDASVAVCARVHDDTLVTSDPDDMRRLTDGVDMVVF